MSDLIKVRLKQYRVLKAVVIHIKVWCVRWTADVRDVGSVTFEDVLPVNAGKEWVLFEVLNAVLTQPVLSAADESADQVFGIFRDVRHMSRKLEPLLWEAQGKNTKPLKKCILFLINCLRFKCYFVPCGS